MAGVRAMLSRVHRLEQARAPASPFQRCWGSLEAWEADVAAKVAAGVMDRTDAPAVVAAVWRWHRDAAFAR